MPVNIEPSMSRSSAPIWSIGMATGLVLGFALVTAATQADTTRSAPLTLAQTLPCGDKATSSAWPNYDPECLSPPDDPYHRPTRGQQLA